MLTMTNEVAEQEVDFQKVLVDIPRKDRAAIFLMTLGEREAAEVLRHMEPEEVETVGSAMSSISKVAMPEVEGVLSDFLSQYSDQTGLGLGTDGYIRNMLIHALGEDRATSVLDRILADKNSNGIESLRWMDARSVASAIKDEHPQIQAVVLSYLDSEKSALILANFPEKARSDIVLRIASLESVQPEALVELNRILEKQFSGKGSSPATNLGGTKTAADIMNNLDGEIETELMDSIRTINEEVGAEIQDLMFVFANLMDVDDRGIQALLREVSTDVLITALKGTDDELQEKIFGNMSKRAAELLKDDLEAKGPVRLSDVETAQKDILATARRMADNGEIQLGSGGEAML